MNDQENKEIVQPEIVDKKDEKKKPARILEAVIKVYIVPTDEHTATITHEYQIADGADCKALGDAIIECGHSIRGLNMSKLKKEK